jgi:hypothetical protein
MNNASRFNLFGMNDDYTSGAEHASLTMAAKHHVKLRGPFNVSIIAI